MLKFRLLPALLVGLLPSAAMAADVLFQFDDGPTSQFFGRQHVAGSVTGRLNGLSYDGVSRPTSITIFSSPDQLLLEEGTFQTYQENGFGFALNNGNVVAAGYLFNLLDGAGNRFQLRFDCGSGPSCTYASGAGFNSLFWNGGNTPIVGTGNEGGFAGARYTAVPEASTWSMMIVGFGVVGAGWRRTRSGARRVRPLAS